MWFRFRLRRGAARGPSRCAERARRESTPSEGLGTRAWAHALDGRKSDHERRKERPHRDYARESTRPLSQDERRPHFLPFAEAGKVPEETAIGARWLDLTGPDELSW